MIPHGVEVFVSIEPVDMRLGFDRLAGLAEERVQRPVRRRALFLLRRCCGAQAARRDHRRASE